MTPRLTQLLYAALIAFCAAPALGAETAQPAPVDHAGEAAAAGFLERQLAKLDPGQAFISSKVVGLGHTLDSLLGEDEQLLDAPGSLLKLRTSATASETGGSGDASLKLKLALPHTERKLSLLIESRNETDEDNGVTRDVPDTDSELSQDLVSLALRAVFFPFKHWDASADAGLRVRTPIDPFTRVRLRRNFQLNGWQLRFKETGFWYHSIGSGASSEFQLHRPVGERFHFYSNTQVTWLHEEQQFFYNQDFLLSQRYSSRDSLGYNIGIRGESEPNDRVTFYFANVHWRRRIHNHWLYLEIIPQLAFDRENGFAADPSMTLALEALFGDTRR